MAEYVEPTPLDVKLIIGDGQTSNHDIWNICSMMRRFADEMQYMQSADVPKLLDADKEDVDKYIATVEKAIGHAKGEPNPKFCKTHPSVYNVGEFCRCFELNNDWLEHIVNLCRLFYLEALNCNSTRLPCGLLEDDHDMLMAILGKIKDYITSVMVPLQPLNLPETIPSVASLPRGQVGLKPGTPTTTTAKK